MAAGLCRQAALEGLNAGFVEEARQQQVSLRRRVQAMEEEAEEAVYKVREQHEKMKEALVRWAVERISRP